MSSCGGRAGAPSPSHAAERSRFLGGPEGRLAGEGSLKPLATQLRQLVAAHVAQAEALAVDVAGARGKEHQAPRILTIGQSEQVTGLVRRFDPRSALERLRVRILAEAGLAVPWQGTSEDGRFVMTLARPA